ncbi:hypothetical protein [Nibricoccus sp. IMCC34717]|uniref:hypothetical protein n=1 Tax=Nibricoccus sp. IMCC34717 TaxID=3034021 RepID=UPI00384F1021
MNSPQTPKEPQVTLEALLRLKRAERPSPEFWVQFDAELKRRQLAAAIEQRRPWWQFSPRLVRFGLPVGAAAAVALSFFATRSASPVATPSSEPVAVDSRQSEAAVVASVASSDLASRAEQVGGVSQVQPEAQPAVALGTPAGDVRLASNDSPFRESLRIAPPAHAPGEASLDLPRVSLAAVTQTVALQVPRSESAPARARDVWQDSRRARLQAYAEPALGNNARDNSRNSRTRERVASRLNEQALADSIGRLGMAEGRLLIRF